MIQRGFSAPGAGNNIDACVGARRQVRPHVTAVLDVCVTSTLAETRWCPFGRLTARGGPQPR